MNARDLIARTLDPGSWRSWDTPVDHQRYAPVSEEYAASLARARERSGLDESIITGEGTLAGRPVALVIGDFAFLGGSIGVATAERFVAAADRARERGLPLIASPASGGTRMQEGTVAFLQMVKISAAVAAHRAAGLPYLVYLRNPTMGGVLASWGMLGHVCAAEPGALIGFLGPRVFEALNGEPFPRDVQTAENLFRHGLIDAVVGPDELRTLVIDTLDVIGSRPGPEPGPAPEPVELPDRPAWDSITASRAPGRPGARELLQVAATSVVPLNGTGEGEADPAMLLALARFGDTGCVVLGHDRRAGAGVPIGPAGLREARRGMRLAAELGLPLVSIVDTAGAALSREAEEGGLSGEIARSLADLTMLAAPTVCLLLGQGAGGMALALLPADRVIAAENGWVSPLPPEGASEILYRTPTRAAEIAGAQRVRARDLLHDGIVDVVVPEYADEDAEVFLRRIGAALQRELRAAIGTTDRPATRLARYRSIGIADQSG
ncbi:carboxyl transferase domain-containing protein [Kineosporia succinea]|uniref:Acetyl-CoA carboxylase carboxyl transferase subunit beta n=1 Tax=Kineosporia succinea TaxID=84632 RepID=A0ABT9P1F8_9ACTN|nr:carboxyl transferase domain-containing protein [Kineosporia succinea]MDP9826522.1 acetyl-CoA carboxylase carboxyl transferase subunit beta [Kineosporia succinea]